MKMGLLGALVAAACGMACGEGHSTATDADASVTPGPGSDGGPQVDASIVDASDSSTPPSDANGSSDAPVTTCQGLVPYPVAGSAGLPCKAPPGSAPSAACDDSENKCTGGGCAIDEVACGSSSTCLPMASNAGKATHDYRVRSLHIVAPSALAQAFVQQVIFTKNIDLNAAKCGEQGNGALNLLIRLDTAAQTVTMGSAPISSDPFKTGYCFLDTPFGGAATRPQTACVKDGWSGKLGAVVLAIAVNGDPSNALPIPLHELALSELTATDDCIGSFDARALDKQCGDDPYTCAKWKPGGAMAGYTLLEEADLVQIGDLNESLCVLLTKSTKGTDGKCQRDANGKIKFAGDYCSITKTAGACADSFWFGATFAASAVKIHDGTGVPACQ